MREQPHAPVGEGDEDIAREHRSGRPVAPYEVAHGGHASGGAGSLCNVRCGRDPGRVTTERVVELRTRTILRILGVAIAVAVLLEVVWISRQVVTWVLI